MSVKEQLEIILWYRQQEEAKKIQIGRLQGLKECLERIGSQIREPEKPPDITQEDVKHKIDDMIRDIRMEIIGLFGQRLSFMEMFKHLKDPKQKTVMALRYFCCKDWKKIADYLSCSVEEVKQLHDKAVCELEKNKKKSK
ncbi:MAG: hypothetical protein K5897_09580 [Eubacterium sp.]|nr:hypothetical protein [Eubacterium sp.]